MKIILLDNGHGSNTPGKCSPDRSLLEYKWTREMTALIEQKLKSKGVEVRRIVPEDSDISISERCRRVNDVCRKAGSQNVLLISIHNNAAGADGKWHDSTGFSVFVSKNASTRSKEMAKILTNEFLKEELTGNRSVPICRYWTWSWTTQDIGILKGTLCPAVLTENFFKDNKRDVQFLLSAEGKKLIADLHVSGVMKYLNQTQ